MVFSPDEQIIYDTRNARENSSHYKLFKVELKKDSYCKLINEIKLAINRNNYSLENPHISYDE
jgi:hypothetical protein